MKNDFPHTEDRTLQYTEAVEKYQKIKDKLGKVPFRKDLPVRVANTITRKYPNWFDFLKEQGDLEKSPSNRKMSRYISDEQLIHEIRQVYAELGYPPHRHDYKRTTTAINHFGTWRNFLKEAGIRATYLGSSQFSKEEVLYRVKQYVEKHGRFPVTDQFVLTGVSVDTALRFFGSLENLARALNCHAHRKSKSNDKETQILKSAEVLKRAGYSITRNTVADFSGLNVAQVSSVVSHYKSEHQLDHLTFVEYMELHGFKAKSLREQKRKAS